MTRTAGLPLVVLFESVDRVNEALPKVFQDLLERFVIQGLASRTAQQAILHSGTLQGLDDSLGLSSDGIDLGFGILRMPGLTGGLPFQLSMERAQAGAGIEPASTRWQLDLMLDSFSLTLRGLEAADFVKETGTFPRHLQRIRPAQPVTITGRATLRFEKPGVDQPVQVRFIDLPDPFDPRSPSGGVAEVSFTPPHFFFGTSDWGMTVTRLIFDFSTDYSPPIVLQRGQSAAWMGLMIAEATFYTPSTALGKGGFSAGVRNLMLGSPFGIQGELELQWGRTALASTTVQFRQDGKDTPVTGSIPDQKSRVQLVNITAAQDEPVGIAAALNASGPPEGGAVTDWSAVWIWPDLSVSEGDTSHGTVQHGEVLLVIPTEKVAGKDPVTHPGISFRFVASGEAPYIDTAIGGTALQNVVEIEGPSAQIAALTLTARSTAPGTSKFFWQLGAGAETEGASYSPGVTGKTGTINLKLREKPQQGNDRVAYLQLRLDEKLELMLGTEGGAVLASDPATVLSPESVVTTFDLSDFHGKGVLNAKAEQAVLDAGEPAKVAVPSDGLADVLYRFGGSPQEYDEDRHVRIRMQFDSNDVVGWDARYMPARGTSGDIGEGSVQTQLLDWVKQYSGARFLIIGRCDDIGSNDYNRGLALRRVAKAKSMLAPVVALGKIDSWGEQDGRPGTLVLQPDEQATYHPEPNDEKPVRLIQLDPAYNQPTTWPPTRDTAHESIRKSYRRVDIFAVGGTAADTARTTKKPADPGQERRCLIPAGGHVVATALTSTPESPYRVKLILGWDKPNATWNDWHNLIPNLAEFEYAWNQAQTPLPNLDGKPVDMSRETLTVYGKWVHDEQTEFTRAMLGIRSDGDPRGLTWTESPQVVAAAGFGPMLLSGVDFNNDTIGSAARVAALAAVAAASGLKLGGADPLIGPGSEFALVAIEAETETRSISDPLGAYKVSLTSEYTVKMHLNGGFLGFRTHHDHPVKIRYKDVGIEFDNTKGNFWEGLGLVYKTDSMMIEDPGRWQIDGELGNLLRIVEIALGTGSLWIEGRLALALDVGVVEISEAVIRLTFKGKNDPPEFSLRGLTAKINIPKTIEGEGRLRIEDGGGVRAGVDVSVIPLKLKASAGFAMKQVGGNDPFTFISLYLKVVFPVGIPLGTSGAAIHGFIGQTAINGERAVGTATDVVARELGWWNQPPEQKYRDRKDQYALGVGVVVGTLPDASFCFSATGMLVVAFPDPEVILGVEVQILKIPVRTPTDKKNATNAAITGLIVIDDKAVTVAVSASYEIKKLLKLRVPFGAYFPYSGSGAYVRLGSDGQAGRVGEPITLDLLPDTLNLRAWSYLMIESDGLQNLGGNPDFSFNGFSVGFGAGAGLEWAAGPIKLSASAKLLAGFGTDPVLIKAGIFVSGELNLVVVSVSARGNIILTYLDERVRLDGEFCGEVDLWLFTVKGCATFHFGSPIAINVPVPPAPVASVQLTDRGGRVMGEAAPQGTALQAQPIFRLSEVNGQTVNTGADPKDNHTVWADTAPVLNFRHYAEDVVPETQFKILNQPAGEQWFGSNLLKYNYRLRDVRLLDSNGVPVAGLSGPIDAVWQTSPAHQPDASGAGGALPSGAESTSLKLLDWNPFGWAVPMESGGEGLAGDPATTIANLCSPLPEPARACLFGEDAVETGTHAIRLRRLQPAPSPYPSQFRLNGEAELALGGQTLTGVQMASLLAAYGIAVRPGSVTSLSQTVQFGGTALNSAYRLPSVGLAAAVGQAGIALDWRGRLDQPVRRARLALLVCDSLGVGGDRKTCFDFSTLKSGKYASLQTSSFVLTASDARNLIVVSDQLEVKSETVARPGRDGVPDIGIMNTGAEMKLLKACRTVEMEFYRPGSGKTVFVVVDTLGRKEKVVADGPGSSVITVSLHADAGIAAIIIQPAAKLITLFRFCCRDGAVVKQCESFAALDPKNDGKAKFTHDGYTFESVNPRRKLGVRDAVNEAVVPPKPGQDGNVEIRFPDDGMRVTLPQPCRNLVLYVLLQISRPVKAYGLDESGKAVASAVSGEKQGMPYELRLTADKPITTVVLSGGGSKAFLYRICCNDTRDANESCWDFAGAPLSTTGTNEFIHHGVVFHDTEGRSGLVGRDVIDGEPPKPGSDGRMEMGFAASGFVMRLPMPVTRVSLDVFTFGNQAVLAEATDRSGRRIARSESPGNQPGAYSIVLEGLDIVSVTVMGGGGQAVLRRVCQIAAVSVTETAATRNSLPVVETEGTTWPSKRLSSQTLPDGRICELVEYEQPANLLDVEGFLIHNPIGRDATLVGFCGVDARADKQWAQDQAARNALRDAVKAAAATQPSPAGNVPAPVAREILLSPGERYRIEVYWSWRSWVSADDGHDSPQSAASQISGWNDVSTPQTFEFAVAKEELADALSGDGLNEYCFDPADIARYLDLMEPQDGRNFVFTGDPLWAHFSTRHIEALLDRYGRRIAFEVRRTDPPPQASDAARAAVKAPLGGVMRWLHAPLVLADALTQRLVNVPTDGDCRHDEPAFGGASLAGRFELEPNAMYDFNLIAPKDDGSDPRVVRATRFVTSRYKGPLELLEALGFAQSDVAPFTPQDLLLPAGATLPVAFSSPEVSDFALGAALMAIGADTLPLPGAEPRCLLLWQQGAGATWRIVGMLLDAPEPMRRDCAVEQGAAAVMTTRCVPDSAQIGSTLLRPVVATINWTRVLFVAEQPVIPAVGHNLALRFATSDGLLEGRRQIAPRPNILDAEGF